MSGFSVIITNGFMQSGVEVKNDIKKYSQKEKYYGKFENTTTFNSTIQEMPRMVNHLSQIAPLTHTLNLSIFRSLNLLPM